MLFAYDVVTLASYMNGGKPKPLQLLGAIETVAQKFGEFRYADLRDRHFQFIANRFPHLPLKDDSMESFRKAVGQRFANLRTIKTSDEDPEDTRAEETQSSDSESFTGSSGSDADGESESETDKIPRVNRNVVKFNEDGEKVHVKRKDESEEENENVEEEMV